MAAGWGHWVPPENFILLCGGEIPGLNVTLLPRLAIDDDVDAKFGKQQPNNRKASLRHLRSIWWLVNVQSRVLDSFDWVFYVDDDTFVNVPALMSFLYGIPLHMPMLVSYIWYNPPPPNPVARNFAFPSGGAGMLFTRPGLQQLGSVLFSPLCEVREPTNDVTIGWCCQPGNITRVHSLKFVPYVQALKEFGNKAKGGCRMDAGMVVTVHYVKTKLCQDQVVEFTCLVAARFGWPHPQCNVTMPG
jgi:hypothetical protein